MVVVVVVVVVAAAAVVPGVVLLSMMVEMVKRATMRLVDAEQGLVVRMHSCDAT